MGLSVLSLSAFAKPAEWIIQPNQSTLKFIATQNNAPVEGSFKHFSGEINFDPNDLQDSKIHIVVDMNSIETTYSDLTTTLQTAEWFNITLFPKADFTSTSIQKKSGDQYEAKGSLTIRGQTQPISLSFTAVESPKGHAKVQGDTILKRSAFGIGQGEWASTDEIKNEVKVVFKLEANTK